MIDPGDAAQTAEHDDRESAGGELAGIGGIDAEKGGEQHAGHAGKEPIRFPGNEIKLRQFVTEQRHGAGIHRGAEQGLAGACAIDQKPEQADDGPGQHRNQDFVRRRAHARATSSSSPTSSPTSSARVHKQCAGARFAALDSMNLWIEIARDSLVPDDRGRRLPRAQRRRAPPADREAEPDQLPRARC